MFKCPFDNCSYENDLNNSFRAHIQHHHKRSAKELYDALHPGEGKCTCGCGEEPKFNGVKKGYSKYKPGHQSRVNNNFKGSDPEKRNKNVSEGRKRSFAEGNFQSWNKGETAETDPRIAAYGEKGSQTIRSNPEEIQKRSARLSENRLNGTVRTLYGSEHSQWNGGYSRLAELAHSYLYKSWKLPKLQATEFKCQNCGATGSLHVHHTGERFASILQEVSREFDYQGEEDFDLKSKIAHRIEKIHLERNVPGIVLCTRCHDAEHVRLGENFNILKVRA